MLKDVFALTFTPLVVLPTAITKVGLLFGLIVGAVGMGMLSKTLGYGKRHAK